LVERLATPTKNKYCYDEDIIIPDLIEDIKPPKDLEHFFKSQK